MAKNRCEPGRSLYLREPRKSASQMPAPSILRYSQTKVSSLALGRIRRPGFVMPFDACLPNLKTQWTRRRTPTLQQARLILRLPRFRLEHTNHVHYANVISSSHCHCPTRMISLYSTVVYINRRRPFPIEQNRELTAASVISHVNYWF